MEPASVLHQDSVKPLLQSGGEAWLIRSARVVVKPPAYGAITRVRAGRRPGLGLAGQPPEWQRRARLLFRPRLLSERRTATVQLVSLAAHSRTQTSPMALTAAVAVAIDRAASSAVK